MTAFTYRGRMDGRDVEGTVSQGAITGPWPVTSMVLALVEVGGDVMVGPWWGQASLEDELMARATLAAVVDDLVTDPPPPRDDPPDPDDPGPDEPLVEAADGTADDVVLHATLLSAMRVLEGFVGREVVAHFDWRPRLVESLGGVGPGAAASSRGRLSAEALRHPVGGVSMLEGGAVGALVRHEWWHHVEESLPPWARGMYRRYFPQTEGEDLDVAAVATGVCMEAAASWEETGAYVFAAVSDPEFDPDRWPDWVSAAGSAMMEALDAAVEGKSMTVPLHPATTLEEAHATLVESWDDGDLMEAVARRVARRQWRDRRGRWIDMPRALQDLDRRLQVKPPGAKRRLSAKQLDGRVAKLMADVALDFAHPGPVPTVERYEDRVLPSGAELGVRDGVIQAGAYWAERAGDPELGVHPFRQLVHEATHALLSGDEVYTGPTTVMIEEGAAELLSIDYWERRGQPYDARDAARRGGRWTTSGNESLAASVAYPEHVSEFMRRLASGVGWQRGSMVAAARTVMAADKNDRIRFRDATRADFPPPLGFHADAESLMRWFLAQPATATHKDDPESFWERMEMLGHGRLQEARQVTINFDPKLHPRDRMGRFIETLNLVPRPGRFGGPIGVVDVADSPYQVARTRKGFAVLAKDRPVEEFATADEAAARVESELVAAEKMEATRRELEAFREETAKLKKERLAEAEEFARQQEALTDDRYPRDEEGRHYFYRLETDPDVARMILDSGELWGRPRRNIYATDRPTAKAHRGRIPDDLPPGMLAVEFVADAPPDTGSPLHAPQWSGDNEGVRVEGEWAKLPVQITRHNLSGVVS